MVICSLTLLSSCYVDKIEPLGAVGDVSFSNDVIPIFEASCNTGGCHASGAIPPDLSAENAYKSLFTFNNVNTEDPITSILYIRMNSNGSPMPPDGKLSNVKINTILQWIKQGAENN